MELRPSPGSNSPSDRLLVTPTQQSPQSGGGGGEDPNSGDPFLGDEHYNSWIRSLQRTTRLRESLIKFTYQLLIYCGETGSLWFTLVTGIVIPTKDTEETVWALLLYFICCVVTALVNYFNDKNIKYVQQGSQRRQGAGAGRKSSGHKSLEILLNFLMILKPYRYYKEYRTRNDKLKIMRESSFASTRNGEGVVIITEPGLQALTELNSQQLEDKRVDLHETFFQSIPMSLLQCYFLFQSYTQFKICDMEDVSRLTTILCTILNAAKASSVYEAAKLDYTASLHFLSYFKSKGTHPMRINSQDLLSLAGFFNLVVHISTILSRFYMYSYFMVHFGVLALLSLFTIFVVNSGILHLFPRTFLETQENSPFGVSTTVSYWADRFINIFSNVNTRFNRFSERLRITSKYSVRVPLILVQLLHFISAAGLMFLVGQMMTISLSGNDFRVDKANGNITLESVLEECPELAEYSVNPFFTKLGELLFSSYTYQTVQENFSTFNDIFNLVHLNWLLFYAQVLASIVYAYALSKFDICENFPCVTGYQFWTTLIHQITGEMEDGQRRGTREEKVDVRSNLRKLMYLTMLKPHTFYEVTRTCGGIFRKRVLSAEEYSTLISELVAKLEDSDTEVDDKIQTCFRKGHILLREFHSMWTILRGWERSTALDKIEDKRLFLIFYAYFDNKMYSMTSDRIERTFSLLEIPVQKTVATE